MVAVIVVVVEGASFGRRWRLCFGVDVEVVGVGVVKVVVRSLCVDWSWMLRRVEIILALDVAACRWP